MSSKALILISSENENLSLKTQNSLISSILFTNTLKIFLRLMLYYSPKQDSQEQVYINKMYRIIVWPPAAGGFFHRFNNLNLVCIL
jgi:hypothetical protein